MYTAADLKPFLQQRYDRAEWVTMLEKLFGFERTEFFASAAKLEVSEAIADRVAAMRQFGYVELGDPAYVGYQHRLALVEVELKTGKTLVARNRVGLRALTYPYVDGVQAHGVLAFYYDPEQADYRLSFQTKLAQGRGTSAVPDFVGTDRRRYTFVLGPHEAARTAADRLSELSRRAGRTTLDNVLEAFSVERLGSDFFKRYKGFYEEFIKQLNDNPAYRTLFGLNPKPAKNLYELEDKPLRDYAKRLLGRLVFLHFLQKKGWMGCAPDRQAWTGGSPEFLLDLFRPFREADRPDFYSAALVPLFFETLSRKRADDLFRVVGMSGPCRVPYLNGGLFEEETVGEVAVDVRRIDFPADLFGRLLDFFAQYNFTIEENRPEDHDVGIDPEMLGHIFENLLEENRTKGAIYTPRPIVQYMCQESLIGYLHGRLEKEGIDRAMVAAFVREHDVQPALRERAGYVEKLLEDVRICDPAIGSGAFPIGLLQELFAARLYLYPYLSNERRRAFDPAEVKKQIVAHNIYGVDLDSGAVDIARLRFWLALVVDEPDPVPLPNLDFKVMQGNSLLESFEGVDLSKLTDPAAGDGDTLVLAERGQFELGAEFSKRRQPLLVFSSKQKADLLRDITEFFEADASRKAALRAEIGRTVDGWLHAEMERDRLRVQTKLTDLEKFLTERLGPDFGPVLAAKPNSKQARDHRRLLEELERAQAKEQRLLLSQHSPDRPYFLWHLYFKDVFDRGGFDIVIANPPYMRVQETRKGQPDVKPEYEHYYADITSGAYDLANLFVAQALRMLLHPQGTACFIFPHKFFNAEAGAGLRRVLDEGQLLHRLVHFGANPVFNGVNTYVCIALLQRQPAADFQLLRLPYPTPAEHYAQLLADDSRFETVRYQTLRDAARLHGSDQWILMESAVEYALLEALYTADAGDSSQSLTPEHESRYTLGDNVDIFVGLQTSNDDLYVLEVDREYKSETHWRGHNEIDSSQYWLVEKSIWKPFLRGRDVHRYEVQSDPPDHVVLFPYVLESSLSKGAKAGIEKPVPIPFGEFERIHRDTYKYLVHYEKLFKARESGKSTNWPEWYRFLRENNTEKFLQEKPRLISMEICTSHPNVTLNDGSNYHTTTVWGWLIKNQLGWSDEFLLAIANSRLIWWFLKRTGDTLQGDARRFFTRYLNPFPLPRRVPLLYQEALATLARHLLWLHDKGNAPAVPNLPNSAVADLFRDVVDLGVCELYLGEQMAEKRLDILTTVAQDIQVETSETGVADQAAVILRLFRRWQQPDSIVRSRLQVATVRMPEWLGAIFSV
ncbi:Eco57I restriction-modification methylase domain-containing protein [Hymenobacter terricola]|uniref:Eco57I restriction-modification methylase domain-containing protein n=1 Tax=Hymenobacter terricola TaxID=2819236 RepID=UPI001B30CCFC|nr:Eco57I restriction-modification methylase domain-containing protein [Hymenobacter terricola]